MDPIVKINHQALDRAFQFIKASKLEQPRDILLLSAYVEDFALVKGHFAEARIFAATVKNWDLNQAFPAKGGVDLVVTSNVFHYSPNPTLWFENVLRMTRLFVVQDLISRRRSKTADGLCDDGDRVRYSYSAQGVTSDLPGAYDLDALGDQILRFEEFEGGRNEHYLPPAAPRHYCAVVQSPYEAGAQRLSWSEGLRFRLPALALATRAALRSTTT